MNNIQSFRDGKIAEGRAMWESPITQVSTQLEQKMHEEEDKLVIEVSRIIGYDINKEELIKALNYSQEQFAKGYAKGHETGYKTGYAKAISDVVEKIKSELVKHSFTRKAEEGNIFVKEYYMIEKSEFDKVFDKVGDTENKTCMNCSYYSELGICHVGHICLDYSEWCPKMSE